MDCRVFEMEETSDYKYVVVLSRYQGKLLLSQHRDRNTWETQGGHIEPGETPAVFYAEIGSLGPIPESEMARTRTFDGLPENLTYPDITPHLFERVKTHFA